VIEMLAGAMAELNLGDASILATDVGPLIDAEAHANIARHVERLRREARLIAETTRGAAGPAHIAPVAFEIARIADLQEEVFGPVLHVARWSGEVDALVEQINALGYGLTLGVQTRIDSRALRIADSARVGNVYVNRNMIGAVVGVQPFGGEGLSGTGPKAGGPHYLDRFTAPLQDERARESTASWAAHGASPPLDTLIAGQREWAARPLAERVATVQRAAARLEQPLASLVRQHTEQALTLLADQALPGPTGESNTLRLHARGVFVLLAQGAQPADVAVAVTAALLAGNGVALVASIAGNAVRTAFVEAGVPATAIGVMPLDATAGLLTHPSLAGVCVLASDEQAPRAVARALAQRDGAIVPLIRAGEARRAAMLWRFCAEQTLTINTAAAGGNAELLAGAGRHLDALAQAA